MLVQACTSLVEVHLAQTEDRISDAAVAASTLHALTTKLPYFRTVSLGGEVNYIFLSICLYFGITAIQLALLFLPLADLALSTVAEQQDGVCMQLTMLAYCFAKYIALALRQARCVL